MAWPDFQMPRRRPSSHHRCQILIGRCNSGCAKSSTNRWVGFSTRILTAACFVLRFRSAVHEASDNHLEFIALKFACSKQTKSIWLKKNTVSCTEIQRKEWMYSLHCQMLQSRSVIEINIWKLWPKLISFDQISKYTTYRCFRQKQFIEECW